MSVSSPTVPIGDARMKAPAASAAVRLFYSAAGSLLLILMVVGFRYFFLEGRAHPGRDLTPPIRTLVILHGVTMSAWVLLFVAQSLLIANRNYRVHMTLGLFGVILAAAAVIQGLQVSIASVRVAPPDVIFWSMSLKQFMAITVGNVLVFAVLVGIALWNRRRPEIHRPMMLLATLSLIAAALARIDALNALYQGTVLETVFGPFLGMLVLGALFLIAHRVLSRSFDRWYALGYVGLALSCIMTVQFATTWARDRIATFLLR